MTHHQPQPSNPKQSTDRHETDYERWLKDHDEYYQLAGKPRYHPSDTENTNEDEDENSLSVSQHDTDTKMNSKPTSKTTVLHSHAETIDVDQHGTVVQGSRYGSVLFASKHQSAQSKHIGTSAESTVMRVGQGKSMVCCELSILFLVVVLVGMAWGVKGHRDRDRQRQWRGRGREHGDVSVDLKDCEKVC
jgi:hypothetical protein